MGGPPTVRSGGECSNPSPTRNPWVFACAAGQAGRVSDYDLSELIGPHLQQLPTAVDGNHEFEFTAESVPDLPDVLRCDGIVITREYTTVNGCWRADNLQVQASRSTMRALGLLAMSALFLPEGRSVEVSLSHPASEIKLLRVGAPWVESHFVTRPVSYTYFPAVPQRHPWYRENPEPGDLPAFLLTDREELGGVTDADWEARDPVVGFGTARGMVRLAALLLDIGNPNCVPDEFQLEGEWGFRGVAPLSADVSFWLPGSLGWMDEYGLD